MPAALRALPRSPRLPTSLERLDVTLLELVTAVSEVADDDREVVETVMSLLRSGRVRLCGSFRGKILSP